MCRNPIQRRGAIAPLTAILLPLLMAMLAFSIDLGWITHTRNELQAAADAAALAGAGQLPDGYVQYYSGNPTVAQQAVVLLAATNSAKTAAKKFAG